MIFSKRKYRKRMLEKGYELIHIDRSVIKEFKSTTTKGKMMSSLECYKKLQRDWYMGEDN